SDGITFLVEADGELPPVLPNRVTAKRLSAGSLPAPREAALRAPQATVFAPEVDAMVAVMDSARYFPWISRLAGAQMVIVGGQLHTFTTRSSPTSQCRLAEQYVHERFEAMGYTDVAYDPFTVSGTQARNVIATKPGTTTPDRIYIVCGHLDSTSPQASTNAPGANDNASGTAVVLAIAELLSDYDFESTIKFIAFTGEEQGLVGSTHYAAAALAAGDDIRGVVNCDMVAYYNSHYNVDIEGRTFANAFMQVMRDACIEYTGLGTTMLYNAWGSDHVPFLDRGYPCFLAIESDYASYPCYHQTCDTADRNDATFGVEVTRACLATVTHLAGLQGPSSTSASLLPGDAARLAAVPNPFRGATELRFALPAPGPVRITVHDVAGRLVRTITDGVRPVGAQHEVWDGRTDDGRIAGAGIYFVRLSAAGAQATTQTVRLR
ncbi:M28 family peptidase, partial [bacterium]|nr:M28 family peptidase [bacterium]